VTGSFPGRSPWMPNVFLVTTIFSDDLLRKLYNREIWRKMEIKSSFFTQEMHCKGVTHSPF